MLRGEDLDLVVVRCYGRRSHGASQKAKSMELAAVWVLCGPSSLTTYEEVQALSHEGFF